MWIISLRKSLGVLSVLLVSSAMSWAGPKPQEVFKDAYYQEVHEGDLAGAVRLYEKVIVDGKTPADVLAEAKSRLACCVEDLRAENPASLMPPNVGRVSGIKRAGQASRAIDRDGGYRGEST